VNLLEKQLSTIYFNPLNTELNPTCHLLALLGAHHILHVSRERFKDVRFPWVTLYNEWFGWKVNMKFV